MPRGMSKVVVPKSGKVARPNLKVGGAPKGGPVATKPGVKSPAVKKPALKLPAVKGMRKPTQADINQAKKIKVKKF